MTTPKAKYDQVTSLGIATKAMTAGEFNKLPLTTIPFSPLRPSSISWSYRPLWNLNVADFILPRGAANS